MEKALTQFNEQMLVSFEAFLSPKDTQETIEATQKAAGLDSGNREPHAQCCGLIRLASIRLMLRRLSDPA